MMELSIITLRYFSMTIITIDLLIYLKAEIVNSSRTTCGTIKIKSKIKTNHRFPKDLQNV